MITSFRRDKAITSVRTEGSQIIRLHQRWKVVSDEGSSAAEEGADEGQSRVTTVSPYWSDGWVI